MKISKWAKQAGWVLSRAIYCTIVIPGQDHDRNERQSCACLPNLHLWGHICCLAHKKQSNITLSRELMAMMMKSQMKANMDQNMVTRKTAYVFTRRVSSSGITNTLKGGAVERKKGRSGKNCPIYQDFRRRGGLHLIALITRRLKAPEPMIRLRRRFFNLIQKSVLLIHNHYLQSLSTIIMWWKLFFYLMPRGSALKSLKRMPIIESSISGAVLRWQEKDIQWN